MSRPVSGQNTSPVLQKQRRFSTEVSSSGPINFYQLDLAPIKAARRSAEYFLKLEDRLDVVICNADIGIMSLAELAEDEYEQTFATNRFWALYFRGG